MIRKVKYKEIREISEELKREIYEIKNNNNKLLSDVLKIRESYKGNDAEIIISKFSERIRYIEEYIKIVEVYNNYFEWISGSYDDAHKNALTRLENMNKKNINLNTINIEIEGEKNV